MADAKENAQADTHETIKNVENELKELRRQLHKIEEQIRGKSAELSTVLARSVSIADIDEILDMSRDTSDTSLLSMDSMERKDSRDNESTITISPTSKTTKSTKKKKKKKGVDKKRKASALWKELEKQIKDGNMEYVKKLIQLNKVKINDNTQCNGRTILMMAAEHGQYDICCMLINLGADVTMTTKYDSTRDAKYFAHKQGNYHIERLLLISSFGGESSAKINEMIDRLKKQQAMNQDFIRVVVEQKSDESDDVEWIQKMSQYLCGLIQKKMVFSDDILSLCWYYTVYKYKDKALNSYLWRMIIKSCEEVIQSKDSNSWYWFKQHMLKSTIWLQSDPTFKGINDNDHDNNQLSLNGLLIQQLFDITNIQSMKNSTILKKMEKKFNTDWKALINFDIQTNYGLQPRQDDILNGLVAKYSKQELSQNINPSTIFNALKHYDINQYLPKLILVCHMIDDEFQQCIMNIFDINSATNTNVSNFYNNDGEDTDNDKKLIKYRRGPTKQISRCKVKAENDYRTMKFPTSAHLLDVVRCTLIFQDVNILLKSLREFEDKVNKNQCGVIKEIVRLKNGFQDWNGASPNYADIKLNVLIETDKYYAVIGEIQFLLNDMSIYKLSSHKLYSVSRLDEEYLSLLKIKEIMMDHSKCLLNASYFNDSKQISNLMVVHQKDIKFIQENIDLQRICQTKGVKLLRILKQYMAGDELIIKLKACGGFQIVCSRGYIDMIQYIYLQILPSKTNKYDDMLRNGLAEVINEGHFEILTWMFTENKKNKDFKFLKLWNQFVAADKNAFFRRVCELGKTNCAKLLLRHFGALFDPNDKSNDGYCALMKAVHKKRIETVKWLVTLKKIDLFSENTRGRICLFEAIDVGCFQIAEILLSQYKKQGRDPKEMLLYKASFGHTIQIFIKTAGKRGHKRQEAITYAKKWALQYNAVELQIIDFDVHNVKFSSM